MFKFYAKFYNKKDLVLVNIFTANTPWGAKKQAKQHMKENDFFNSFFKRDLRVEVGFAGLA